MIKSIYVKFLQLLFPNRCGICDTVVAGENNICPACLNSLQFISENICMKCGKEVKNDEEYCYDCKRKKHIFDRNIAVFSYEYIRGSLYRFKYAGRAEYSEFYARAALSRHKDEILNWNAQAIIPVPLHKKRLRKRGYNQAEVFAEALGNMLNKPVCSNLAIRVKNTIPMKNIQGSKRQNNLKKAFLIRENDVKLNTIILVDDIYTTGATLDELARAFRAAGVATIYCITVAIGKSL